MSYYGTVWNCDPIRDDNEFLGYLENCLSIGIQGDYYAIEYNPQELYCRSKTSKVLPQEFFERLDRLLERNSVSFFACIRLFNKLCALRKKTAYLPAVQANIDRLLQALLMSHVVQKAGEGDFMSGLGASIYKEFIDFVKEVLLSEAASRDEDSISLLQQYLSRFIPLLDQGTQLRLALFAGDGSEIQKLYQSKNYKALIDLLIELKPHPKMRQMVLALILAVDQNVMIPLSFWIQYLKNTDPADLKDGIYIDSLQQIFRHAPRLAQSLLFSQIDSAIGIQALLAVSQSYSELDMKEPIRYLFAQYQNRHQVLPWIIDYFLYKKQHSNTSILLTQEEEEQFISNNIFNLLQTYRWNKDNSAFNKLLIEELKIKLIDKSFSDCPMAFIFGFVKQHGIADTHIINALAEWAMKTDALSEQNIMELAGLAVLGSDLVLMRKILNRYNKNPLDETAQGKKWQDFIKPILTNGQYKSKPVAEPMIGLLYGHQQGLLSNGLEFDFLISHCCNSYHRIWLVTNQQDMAADSDLRIHESSMMDQNQAAPVYKAAKEAFPAMNVRASYAELIKYIEDRLFSLEGQPGAIKNKQFIPEHRYDKEVIVNGKREIINVEECLEEMTEQQMAIARYYTALRLLKHDSLIRSSFNPYFDDSGMNFDSMVAHCYEMAKKTGCVELLVAQLADIRRIHSMDAKESALSEEDLASCASGARGRLCRTYVMSHNRQLELAREALGLGEIKKFNSGSINAVIERFVQKTLFAFKIAILENIEVSAIPEEYRYLAAIFACYQKLIAGEFLSDEEKSEAEQAIAYIADKKINYLALYRNLAQLHTNDKISVCPEEVQSALQSYIASQLKALFLLDEESQDKLGAAALAMAGSLEERDLRWKDLPETVVANTYPEILIHFLLADTINFGVLVEHAAYLATPKFRDNMQGILYQLAERLSDQRALLAEDEKSARDAYALFFKQMHTLAASGVIPKEDLSAIFIRVLLVALHNKAFFREIVSFIKGDTHLSETDQREIFARVIISALQHKVPNEKIIHFMEEVNKEFHISVKKQCAVLLDKVPYVHYAQFNKLLGCLVGNMPVKDNTTVIMIKLDELKEIIEAQAKKLIESNDYTSYLRLIRLSLSALNVRIDLYNRDKNKELVKNKQEAVASFLGSFSSINSDRIQNFESLKAASVKGDAYASFALVELYSKGHAITGDGKSRVEDGSLAIVYAAIAIEQAKALGNQDLIREIQSFFGRNTRIFCLEELYYSYLLKLLTEPVESQFYNSALQAFLLIISSVDLGRILDDEYESKNKSAVQKLIAQCCSHNDLVKTEALLRVCEMMQERNAYIQSAGGNVRAADPRNLSTAIRYNLHYQWLLAELKKIAWLKPSSITVQDIYLRLRQAAGAKGSEVAANLKHVYRHLFQDFLYDKDIHHDDEKLAQLLREICEKEQVSLNIIVSSSPFITGSDRHIAKGKEEDNSKGKELVNRVIMDLQGHYEGLFEQLNTYPNMVSVLSDMNDMLTQMVDSNVYTESQIQSLCNLLKVIKFVVADDQEIRDEFKENINVLAAQMLDLLNSMSARVGDYESSAASRSSNAESTSSGAESASSDAESASSDAESASSNAASSSSNAASSSSSSSAGFFVQRNLKGQPYTNSMRSSRRNEASDSRANPVSIASSSNLSSSASRSSRRSDVSDSRSNLVHSASSSSSSSSNPPSDSAGNTMGSRFIHTVSSVGAWFAAPANQNHEAVAAPRGVSVDSVLNDLVDLQRDYNVAIARSLRGIQLADRPKKIALIGDSGVGKSCLLLRLVDGTYTESYISTIGVDFKYYTATIGGQMFRSAIWDLCGQERFRAITHSYHEAASVVLCFDVSDPTSFAHTRDWCREIERYAPPHTKVILIGTKCDLVVQRQVSYETARNFADTLGIYYLEISARDSINIERLGALIALAPYSAREQHLELARDYDMSVARQNRFGL